MLVFAGRMEEGWRLLEDAIARATGDTQQEAEAARGYRMIGSSASALVEYDLAEHWLTEGIGYAEKVELWNHRHYMASHLAHVQWATGQWRGGRPDRAAAPWPTGAAASPPQITAQFVLGYLAMGRGDWSLAADLLGGAFGHGDRMAELQRLSPPLWGLAEAARCRGDHDTALRHCERGYQASADVTDASYLYPYLLTGVRAHLARGDVDAAQTWSDHVGAVLTVRAIPGTLPAIGHARGLLLLARGEVPAAYQALQAAERVVAGPAPVLGRHLGAARPRGGRRPGAPPRRGGRAHRRGSRDRRRFRRRRSRRGRRSAQRIIYQAKPAEPWYPLSEREFEVARLVAAGLTNRQIAEQLVLAPKTISAHVTHILTKLGAARRAEIGAWCATVRQDSPR